MKEAGASRVVALVKENIGTEVADFRKDFWSEEVYMDEAKKFYVAIGGGKENKPFSGLAAFLAMLANPFTKSRTKKNLETAKKAGVAGNLNGEGFVAGGVYVIRQDGKAAYAFTEEDMGDRAPVEDVIAAVKAAKENEVFTSAPAPADPAAPRKTWKEWACRSSGPDGYQIGDFTRGLTSGCKIRGS
eukprot:TRINITY_DN11817_c0_g1_i1.p1 TRINITY_DN11817_c0_g1~~TRINITY_DN11817_c0_g1_i1.p1  ORF type:complete len:187 (+),score=54.16 TRINITY_DN11817_c0_g1_i1:301-861(+)